MSVLFQSSDIFYVITVFSALSSKFTKSLTFKYIEAICFNYLLKFLLDFAQVTEFSVHGKDKLIMINLSSILLSFYPEGKYILYN